MKLTPSEQQELDTYISGVTLVAEVNADIRRRLLNLFTTQADAISGISARSILLVPKFTVIQITQLKRD